MIRLQPHPLARGAALMLAITGTVLATNPVPMFGLWVGVLIPALWSVGHLSRHVKFAIVVVGPAAASLFLVWGWLVGSPPGTHAPGGTTGIEYAATISLRLLLLGGIFQLAILSIPSVQLAPTLRAWGIRGPLLTIILGGFSLGPELLVRADQVVTARFARGLVPNVTPWARAAQLPWVLRPLTAWVLRSALQRGEAWEQSRMAVLIERASLVPLTCSRLASFACVVVGVGWLFILVRF
jgi:energy-coupling factor transporter transmembrane protein EcfT